MGKEGINLALQFIREDMGAFSEEVVDAARYLLEDYWFIYPNEVCMLSVLLPLCSNQLNMSQMGKEEFQSSLVMKSFVCHCKKTMYFLQVEGFQYGDQHRALGVAATVVSRLTVQSFDNH